MSDQPSLEVQDNPLTNENFIDISPEKDGGVMKQIIKEGEGEVPPIGAQVKGTIFTVIIFLSLLITTCFISSLRWNSNRWNQIRQFTRSPRQFFLSSRQRYCEFWLTVAAVSKLRSLMQDM